MYCWFTWTLPCSMQCATLVHLIAPNSIGGSCVYIHLCCRRNPADRERELGLRADLFERSLFSKVVTYPSLNVKDLDTVDDGVRANMLPAMKSPGEVPSPKKSALSWGAWLRRR